MDVATRSDQAVATIEEGLRLDEKEGAVPDGTGWHWDALGCTGMCKWKDMERHGKTWKDHQRQKNGKITRESAFSFSFLFVHARTQDTHADVCIFEIL
jgi:hypothetical protein